MKQIKRPATIGIPISIEVPKGSKYDNAAAEVIVTVKTSPTGRTADEPPGLMTILPREKTYNEATITDKSASLGLAVVTHVFSVGVAGSKHSQTFYIVQDLDTVAFIRDQGEPTACGQECTTAFGWQFRPTLGRKKLRSGLRQAFVQLSFPVDTPDLANLLGTIQVEAHWLKYDPKTGAVGDPIYLGKGDSNSPIEIIHAGTPLPNFNLQPRLPFITWADAGNGQVFVEAQQDYQQGTSVAAGGMIWNNNTAGFSQDANGLHFIAPVSALVSPDDPYVVAPGGERLALTQPAESVNLHVTLAQAAPWSSTDSLVTVSYTGGASGAAAGTRFQPLIQIGNVVFGLSDRPVKLQDASCLSQGACTLVFQAPTDLVRSARVIHVKQLFYGIHGQDTAAINILNEFTATKLTVVAKTNECTLFAIQGSGLHFDNPTVPQSVQVLINQSDIPAYNPKTSCEFNDPEAVATSAAEKASLQVNNCDESMAYANGSFGPSMLLVAVPNCLVSRAKAIELRRGDSGAPDQVQSVLLSIAPDQTTKPQLDEIKVMVGDLSVKLTGKNLELISLNGIMYNGTAFPAQIAHDGSYILLKLPSSFTQAAGFYAITLKLTDNKTTIGALVQVSKPDSSTP